MKTRRRNCRQRWELEVQQGDSWVKSPLSGIDGGETGQTGPGEDQGGIDE